MPRDDWAKARAKDVGRKAKASGEYFTCEPVTKPRKTKKAFRRRGKPRHRPCQYCRSREVKTTVQEFKDGTIHLRVDCNNCGRFRKWSAL